MEVIAELVRKLEAAGCPSCLIGSIHEEEDARDAARLAKAVEWAFASVSNGSIAA